MLKREYPINARNSTVCGYPGRGFDWAKFCWDGSAIYIDGCGHAGHPKQELKAPLPWVDDGLIEPNCQYLHVPYEWAEDCTIYRVRPNETMRAGSVWRGHLVSKQTTIQKGGIWFWVLELRRGSRQAADNEIGHKRELARPL